MSILACCSSDPLKYVILLRGWFHINLQHIFSACLIAHLRNIQATRQTINLLLCQILLVSHKPLPCNVLDMLVPFHNFPNDGVCRKINLHHACSGEYVFLSLDLSEHLMGTIRLKYRIRIDTNNVIQKTDIVFLEVKFKGIKHLLTDKRVVWRLVGLAEIEIVAEPSYYSNGVSFPLIF